jgi:hypothetical protein
MKAELRIKKTSLLSCHWPLVTGHWPLFCALTSSFLILTSSLVSAQFADLRVTPNGDVLPTSVNGHALKLRAQLYDNAGTPKLSFDPNTRIGYASDGTTASLDISNPLAPRFGRITDGVTDGSYRYIAIGGPIGGGRSQIRVLPDPELPYIDIDSPVIDIGDVSGAGHGTHFQITDSVPGLISGTASTFHFQSSSTTVLKAGPTAALGGATAVQLGALEDTDDVFYLDFTHHTALLESTTCSFGDPLGFGNGTNIVIDDTAQTITLSGTVNLPLLNIAGTAGAGYIDMPAQSSAPATPAASHIRLFNTSANKFGWIGASGYVRTFDGTLTASRSFALPDSDTKFPIASQFLTFAGPTAARTITLPDASFTAARTDAAQSFTAGAKQTVTASATTAGFKFGGVTADPSVPAEGDEWYRSDTHKGRLYDGTAARSVLTDGDLGSGVGTFLATPSSANLASAVTDEISAGTSPKALFGDQAVATTSSPTFAALSLTNQVRTGDGTTSAPAWSFSSDTNTGFRRAGAADYRFVYAGTDVFRITNSAVNLAAGNFFSWGSSGVTSVDTAITRSAAGVLEVDSGTAGTYRELKARSVIHNAVTIANLPGSPSTGQVAAVTDGDASLAWGATVVNSGAGATKYLVWYNGANWTVAGK